MADLFLHDREVSSIFELLGTNENDITYSVGWAMARSPRFLEGFLRDILPAGTHMADKAVIRLQEYRDGGGITDVEVVTPTCHVIIEAKRGQVLSSQSQLERYAPRLEAGQRATRAMVVLSDCPPAYAAIHLSATVNGFPVVHRSWTEVLGLANQGGTTHAEGRLLRELRMYLARVVTMQNQLSNMVFVVSLGAGRPENWGITWRAIVGEKLKYFHPVGNRWPKEPPNYIGFRYDGKLQSIHHIDDWKIVDEVHDEIPEIPRIKWEPHYLYSLGPAIRPAREVKGGRVFRNGRVWAMLDLLLTSSTISEARDLTQARQAAKP